MKKVALGFLLVLIFVSLTQTKAFAYSYGDPSEEKIAEVYKQMVMKLNESPPNYDKAKEVFLTVKDLIDQHMGTDASKSVLKDFKEKDQQAVIKDMHDILVLNIARRLDNVDKAFEDYDKSKILLAKALATYKALSPVVKGKNPQLDKKLKNEFDVGLESLGNPGLFGVGEKEPNKSKFESSKESILTSLQEQFNLKSTEVGHYSNDKTDTKKENAGESNDWTDYSQLKNWIPIAVIAILIIGVLIYVRKKKSR